MSLLTVATIKDDKFGELRFLREVASAETHLCTGTFVKWKRTITPILGIALAVRAAWALYSPANPAFDYADYDRLALGLAHGAGFVGVDGPTAFRPPGYPFFLATVYRLSGDSLWAARAVNVALGVVTVWLTYLLMRRFFSEPIARKAALFTAFLPNLVLYTPLLASENVAIPLLLGSMIWLWDGVRQNDRRKMAASGGAIALAALTRSSLLLLPVAWLLYALWRVAFASDKRLFLARLWRLGWPYALAVGLVIAPWTARNWRVMGAFIPISSNTGLNLVMSFSDQSTGEFTSGLIYNEFGALFHWSAYRLIGEPHTEIAFNEAATTKATDWIKDNPAGALKLVAAKWWFLWRDDTSGARANFQTPSRPSPDWVWRFIRIVAQAVYMAFMALVLLAWRKWRQLPSGTVLLLVPVFYFMAMHAVFFGSDRFHLPLMPLLAGFAAWQVLTMKN